MVQPGDGRGPEFPIAGGSAMSEQAIADRIFSAVMDQRLPPGTKLSENVLCASFGVGRARIRRALLMLAQREVVELRSNRGAFVACPTADEARDVFAARRAIEPGIVQCAVAVIREPQIAELTDHVDRENAAHLARNRHEAIWLSGSFHIRLAELAGNPVLTRFVKDLVARTSLIIGLFGSPGVSSCLDDEHRTLIAAIADGDADLAADWMGRHLTHIESGLRLRGGIDTEIDVRAILDSESGASTPPNVEDHSAL
jgi:DNA-binding GntR family transcriptional regulator